MGTVRHRQSSFSVLNRNGKAAHRCLSGWLNAQTENSPYHFVQAQPASAKVNLACRLISFAEVGQSAQPSGLVLFGCLF
jgi:hypothetical protein